MGKISNLLGATAVLFLLLAPTVPLAAPPRPGKPVKKQPPRLQPLPKSLRVAIGEPLVIAWVGGGKEIPKVVDGDPQIVDLDFKRPGICRIIGKKSADFNLVLDWGKEGPRWTIPVSFRPPAVKITSPLQVSVTGSQDLAEALRHLLMARMVTQSNLQMTVEADKNDIWRAKIHASAPEFISVDKTVVLQVERQNRQAQTARLLYLSNRPEKLAEPGILFERTWNGEAPCRWLFHHKSVAPPDLPDLWLELRCRNRSNAPTKFHVAVAALGPARDEIYVGHIATQKFLEKVAGPSLVGWYLTVPAQSEIVLERLRLKSGQTVSGVAMLTPIQPGSVDLRVVACQLDGSQADQTVEDLGKPGRTARGIYPAEILQNVTYRSGDRFLYIDLGAPPYLQDIDPGRDEKSPGNFGAVYRYALQLTNPSSEFYDFAISVSARGGPARGHFFVDGALKDPGNIGANPQDLQRWRLAPGEQRSVYVETFPQSGSNYPVSLVVGAVKSKLQEPADPPQAASPEAKRLIP